MKTILIPTDFSKNSDNAIHFGLELNRKLLAKVILFHSYFIPVLAGEDSLPMVSDDELKKGAEKSMKQLKANVQHAYPEMKIETMIRPGFAVDEIETITADKKAELLVMGTQGASGLREVLIGSITSAVMESVTCPVLAIPENTVYKGFQKIVFATNFADNDFENVENVIDLARWFDAEVILLHVSTGETDKAFEYAAIENFKEKMTSESSYGRINFKLLENHNVVDGLSLYLDEIKADMLAMSMRHRNFFQRIFNRSKTKQMAFHTHIPLLAFHAE